MENGDGMGYGDGSGREMGFLEGDELGEGDGFGVGGGLGREMVWRGR